MYNFILTLIAENKRMMAVMHQFVYPSILCGLI